MIGQDDTSNVSNKPFSERKFMSIKTRSHHDIDLTQPDVSATGGAGSFEPPSTFLYSIDKKDSNSRASANFGDNKPTSSNAIPEEFAD